MSDDSLLREEASRRLAIGLSVPAEIAAEIPTVLGWLAEIRDRMPPVVSEEEQLQDGTILIRFHFPGPPYAAGGTLVIPAGVVFPR
jgi:hypothetical protein